MTILAAGLALGLSAPARATLIGDEVQVQFVVDDGTGPVAVSGGPTTVTADATDTVTLLDIMNDMLTVDLDAFTVVIDFMGGLFFTDQPFNGIVISDLDWQDGDFVLSGIDVDAGALVNSGWSDDSATSTGDSISIDFAGLEVGPFTMVIDLLREAVDGGGGGDPDPDPTPVPEPQALALLGLGLLGLAAVRRHLR